MFKVLCLGLLVFANLATAEVVSTGVGLVRGTLVTSREVQIQNLLDVAMYEKKPADKLKTLSLDSKAFSRATQDVLLETVVSLEAQTFNVVQISADDIRDSVKKANKVLGNSKAWKALGVSSKELDGGVKRKLQAKKFIQFRAQSSVLPVTDSEAQRYFEENRLKFGDLPFENFKENIKSFLSRAQVDRRLKDWYEVLLNKYQVKNLIAEM